MIDNVCHARKRLVRLHRSQRLDPKINKTNHRVHRRAPAPRRVLHRAHPPHRLRRPLRHRPRRAHHPAVQQDRK